MYLFGYQKVIPMFRKKRVPTKTGYKIMPIKENGKIIVSAYQVWNVLLSDYGLDRLQFFLGPTILFKSGSNKVNHQILEKHVSEHDYVAIWVPEDYEYV